MLPFLSYLRWHVHGDVLVFAINGISVHLMHLNNVNDFDVKRKTCKNDEIFCMNGAPLASNCSTNTYNVINNIH